MFEEKAIKPKTYVLLDSMNATAPVYQQLPDGQRVQITKIPYHHPTRRQSFFENSGKSRVIRYKSHSSTIDQAVQIKEENILANEPFTPQETKDLEFRFGVLTTMKVRAQEYLEAHPEYDKFDGFCDDVKQPKYKLLDEAAENKIKNIDTRLRVKAMNKIFDLTLDEAKSMIIRLNGSFVQLPDSGNPEDDLEECVTMLTSFIDESEIKGLEAVLLEEKEVNIDDQTTILIGKLINQGSLSFDAVEGKISKKDKAGKWIVVRDMSAEYSLDERKRLFSDFLNTEDGKALKTDLEKDLKTPKGK